MKKIYIYMLIFAMCINGISINVMAKEENNLEENPFQLNENEGITDESSLMSLQQDGIEGTQQIIVNLKEMKVYLNDNMLCETLVENGTNYLPLRTIVRDIYNGMITQVDDVYVVDIENLNFSFKISSNEIIKNNIPAPVELPLIQKDGTVYCPIKILPIIFGMKINYLSEQKQIVIDAPIAYYPEVITTFADFDFEAPIYVQGQQINIIEKSYDTVGKVIVERQWKFDGDDKSVQASPEKFLKKPVAGLHTLALRVKNESGKWSDWVEKDILINENEKPIVTEITGIDKTYAQGEKFTIGFNYANEEWEKIVSEKWSYRKKGDTDVSWVYLKPEFFFREGEYEVCLSIQDEYGNWSESYTGIINISDEVMDTELNYKFNLHLPGIFIDNFERRNYREMEEIPLNLTSQKEGTLIFSDSPEVVTNDGILYQEYMNGNGRINFHHINNYDDSVAKNKKVVIIAENTTDVPITMIVTDKTIRGPAQDSMYVGQLLTYYYLLTNGYVTYTLQPHEKIFLVDTKDKNWIKGTTIAGQLDINTTGNVKFTVASANKEATIQDVENSPVLNRDIHPRGTYFVTDLYYDIVAKGDKETCFIIGKGQEEWIQGIDAIEMQPTMNRGNYGITYHISITAEEDMGVLINPRGGAYRGAIRLNGINTFLVPQVGCFGSDNTKAAIITTIDKGETVVLDYILPNGSASPNLFALIPKKMWK